MWGCQERREKRRRRKRISGEWKKKELIIVKKMLKSGSGYSFYTKRLSFYPAKREKKNRRVWEDLKSVKSFENLFNQQKTDPNHREGTLSFFQFCLQPSQVFIRNKGSWKYIDRFTMISYYLHEKRKGKKIIIDRSLLQFTRHLIRKWSARISQREMRCSVT